MTTDRVKAALAAVPEDHYTREEDGGLVRQSSSVQAIAAGLERLDVRPGMRVLEIGTGSGFSGALLGELVGPTGSVVSMDVMGTLTARARDLHGRRGAANVHVVTGDGAHGHPDRAPYDRVVAWAATDVLWRTWADQCVPGAVLIVPVTLASLPRSTAIVRAHRTRTGTLEAERLWTGGYVEMHPEELTQWLVPPRGVDAATVDAQGRTWWVGGMRGGDAEAAVKVLSREVETTPLLDPAESAADLHLYLYAADTDGLCMLGLGDRGWAPGHTTATGAAAVTADGRLATAGDPAPARTLRHYIDRWRAAGRPGADHLTPVLEETRDGWLVRSRITREG